MQRGESVDMAALAALGRVVRETAEDIQRRKLASLSSAPRQEKPVARCVLVRHGHDTAVEVFLSPDQTRITVVGLDASSICERFERVVAIAPIIKLVVAENRIVTVWLARLPPLQFRFMALSGAEAFAATLLECLHSSTRSAVMVGAAPPASDEPETDHLVRVRDAATKMAHLSWSASQGAFFRREDDFFVQLGQTGWMSAVVGTLQEASESAESLLLRTVFSVLAKKKNRTASQLPVLLAPFYQACNLARVSALGADPSHKHVFAAIPSLPLLFMFLEVLYQLLLQKFEAFDFDIDTIRLVVLQLQAGLSLTEDFCTLLRKCGNGETLEESEEEEEELLEISCSPFVLRPCPFLFFESDSVMVGATSRNGEIEALRSTVGKLMSKVSAQDAAIKMLSAQSREFEEGKKRVEESKSEVVKVDEGKKRTMEAPKKLVKQEAAPKQKQLSPFRVRSEEKPSDMDALKLSLSKRGEHLELVADETSEMETRSKGLLEMSKQINQEAQAKQARWKLL